MKKYHHNLYTYLSKNKLFYQKALKINNLIEKEKLINDIYYPIIDTIFLTKFIYHELGNYKNIYKIKIWFNHFTLLSDIIIYKTQKKCYESKQDIVIEYQNKNYKNFDTQFIMNNIIFNFDDINHSELLPIFTKCRYKLIEEYRKIFITIILIGHNSKVFIPNYIMNHVITYLV